MSIVFFSVSLLERGITAFHTPPPPTFSTGPFSSDHSPSFLSLKGLQMKVSTADGIGLVSLIMFYWNNVGLKEREKKSFYSNHCSSNRFCTGFHQVTQVQPEALHFWHALPTSTSCRFALVSWCGLMEGLAGHSYMCSLEMQGS